MNKELSKTNPIIAEAQKKRNEGRADLVNLESFVNALSKKPAVTKTNKFANNTQYVPISHVQNQLDTLFFGLWQTKNFQKQVIGNELVGSIELHVYHPILKDWIVRTGVAANQIRQNKGAKISDIDQKIKNALEMDAPHLYADCVKSAAKTLGARFGRNLNRDFTDDYKTVLTNHVNSQSYNPSTDIKALREANTELELNSKWEQLSALAQQDGAIQTAYKDHLQHVRDTNF